MNRFDPPSHTQLPGTTGISGGPGIPGGLSISDGMGISGVRGVPGRIAAPVLPQPDPPRSFPLVATLAPVVMSLALWLLTKSVFALVFAALGPVVAIGSLVDARRSSRRRRRSERSRFESECAAAAAEIDSANTRLRSDIDANSPSASVVLAESSYNPARWRTGDATGVIDLRVGIGDIPGSLELDGARDAASRLSRDAVYASLAPLAAALAARARVIPRAPVVVDARVGVGVVGPPAIAAAAARALVVQLANSLAPSDWRIELSGDFGSDASGWADRCEWLGLLPHRLDLVPASGGAVELRFFRQSAGGRVVRSDRTDTVVIAIASHTSGLPSSVSTVLSLAGATEAVITVPGALVAVVEPELVSREQMVRCARWLTEVARREGLLTEGARLPERVPLAELLPAPSEAPASSGTLRAEFVVGAEGPLGLDLVADGPHAVVGGTTGSGKSELLISWVIAMAAVYPPQKCVVLLVDFKGGASFNALATLPHCVGVISDLDEGEALRALVSLSAEVKYRERVLADAGARSIDELATADRESNEYGSPVRAGVTLPRLVIVVDEFAAMVTGYPDLHTLFADIAARGRSLGMHLVLCTQRPAGSVRDSVLANTGLRISLRVHNRADSSAVVGSDAAADLPTRPPGRAVVSIAGEPVARVQVAVATLGDSARVASAWPATPVRRPWLPPLPDRIPASELAAANDRAVAADVLPTDVLPTGVLPTDGGPVLRFGIADRPEIQAQPAAVYCPVGQGNLLVVGTSGSGKSTAIAMMATAATSVAARTGTGSASSVTVRPIASDAASAWDGITAVLAGLRGAGKRAGIQGPTLELVLVDDLDAIVARLPAEYQPEFVDRTVTLLREARAAGAAVVISVQRLSAALGPVFALCDSRLLLRQASKADHLIAGGTADRFDPDLPPGGGLWRGDRVQVAMPERGSVAGAPAGFDGPEVTTIDPQEGSFVVVSRRPAEFAARLGRDFPGVDVTVLGAGTAREIVADAGAASRILVADPTVWQAHGGAFDAVTAYAAVLFDGCSVADYRAITRDRELPPPIVGQSVQHPVGWLWAPGSGVRRARIAVP